MLAVIKLPCTNGSPNNIFITYDFKQVKDSVLLVMYVPRLKSFKKIFITYENGILDTGILAFFLEDDNLYRQVCNTLQLIFNKCTESNGSIALGFGNNIQDHVGFISNILS